MAGRSAGGCKLIRCSCKHEYQDQKYGKGRRIANRTVKNDGKTFRCTVCGTEAAPI